MVVVDRKTATLASVNPTTGRYIATHRCHSNSEVDTILADVASAQRKWNKTSYSERSKHFFAIALKLRQRAIELSRTMAAEMGKPVTQGLAEIEKCVANCDFYAEHAESFLADERLQLEQARVLYQPIGIVLAVMPWNFPFWQVLRCAVPILMAGNAMVLKHASNVMGCAVLIEEILEEAGLPKDVFRTLLIPAQQVSGVIQHPAVAAITLTGSEAAGRAVAAAAGRELKPCVLELGGSDPFIVLEDADVDEASRVGAWARCQNAGQSCIAAKRFIIIDSIYDKFVAMLTQRMEALKVGDPLEEDTEIGPMARADLRDELHDQVSRSVRAGAEVVLGGRIPDSPGAFYPATVVTQAGPGIPVFDEETFGPVAALVRVRNEAEAVAVANDSRFGLGTSVWTTDLERGNRVASQIAAGMVFVNTMTRSDPRLPFGGIKTSGYGRELWVQGIRSFTNVKTVYLA